MGLLITFEGIDGSGKSTQARRLAQHLREVGCEPLMVREPGGTDLSERVRTLLLDSDIAIEPYAELLLFSAARAQLVAERIRPALEEGQVVVCDRFYDSTTAYQGGGRRLETPDWLDDFNRRVTGGLTPDRTYLFELPPKVARQRCGGVDEQDRMEAAGLVFYERVAAAYADLAEANPHRIRRLDGTASISSLHSEVWEDLKPLLADACGTPVLGNGSSH